MKQVGGECPLQGIMPTGKGTPGQEARVFLAFYVLLHRDKGKTCIYALQELSKAWQVIWVFPDVQLPIYVPEDDEHHIRGHAEQRMAGDIHGRYPDLLV